MDLRCEQILLELMSGKVCRFSPEFRRAAEQLCAEGCLTMEDIPRATISPEGDLGFVARGTQRTRQRMMPMPLAGSLS